MLCNSLVVSVVLYFYYTKGRRSGLKETENGKWGGVVKLGDIGETRGKFGHWPDWRP